MIHADIHGEGPPVLLIHGQPGGRADWDQVASYLRRSGHKVIVPDRPGYGLSAGSAGGFASNARRLIELLDSEGIETATVAGYSWGGGVAIAMAELFPDRVSGLALVSSIAGSVSVAVFDRLLASRMFGVAIAYLFLRRGSQLLLHPKAKRALGAGAHVINEDQLKAAIRSWQTGGSWRAFFVEQKALIAEAHHLDRSLGSILCPTTVMIGALDQIIAPKTAREIAERIPGAKLVEIEEAGHLLPFISAERLSEEIAELAAASSA